MTARSLASLSLLLVALIALAAACSSGLGNDPRRRNVPAPATAANANLPLGLDVGLTPTDPIAEPSIAGIVVPAIGATAAREVVLVAFSTAAASNNGDGTGGLLSRDPTTDTNGAADIFVAAVSAQDVERRAFSQSLAGKFRHPRCVTCHMMQADPTDAFRSSAVADPVNGIHAGPPPGSSFPNNSPQTCAPCHVTSNTFPVEGWQAPAASFDMRPKTVAQLAEMARNVPADDIEHFVSDRRVLWALDSGILPQVGGRNGVADDDHDGVIEPEDTDGVPRTVPGGSVAFLREIQEWRATATPGVPGSEVVTAAAAVKDVTLVSRAAGTSNAGNGQSTAPHVKWVPNPTFNPGAAAATNPIGTLFIAYQSTSSDLAAGDTNGAMDVFRAAVELRAEEDATGAASPGSLNLKTLESATLLFSARNGTTSPGNGASARPVIAGNNAQWIAFESVATDLISGFTDANGPGASDVYLRNVGPSGTGTATLLVSHAVGNATTGGNGASEAPSLSPASISIAFESDATDLIASDGNGVRDVFFATGAASPFTKVRASVTSTGTEGSGGACRAASVQTSAGGRTLVAFESDKTNLASSIAATTNVYLFDSDTGATTLLNQRVSPDTSGTTPGANVAIAGTGSARAPVLTPDGATVAFESDAGNIDVLRSDTNGTTDVFLVETAQLATGLVLPFRISVTATEAASGNGASTRPTIGSFTGSASFQVGFAAYTTAATNLGATHLGTPNATSVMVSFLDETSGVIANFTQSVTRGAAPLEVQFTDTSSGTPNAWAWDFDNDGTVDSTEQNPRHTFTAPGTYTVKLVARNPRTEGSKTVVDGVRVVTTIVADFSASVSSGPAPLPVSFTDLSTQAPLSWAWDFDNDGTVDSTDQNPQNVAFPTPGTYTVSLTATNEAGSTTVTKASLIQVFTPVAASFTTNPSPATGTLPLAVNFTSTSTGAASLLWNFGDGSPTATGTTTSHTYTVGGSYTATLTATGFGGDVSVATRPITANSTANFTMTFGGNNVTSRYTGDLIQFSATSPGATTFSWNFGDGSPLGSGASPTHTYSSASFPGSFTVTLTTNAAGSPSTQRTITIVPASESLTPIVASQDTTIYSPSTGNGNGASAVLVVGNTFTAGFRRALLQFSVGTVPANSTILDARVRLRDISPAGTLPAPGGPGGHIGSQLTGTQTFDLHRVNTSWSEGTGNGSVGQGTATGASATFATMGGAGNFVAGATGTITFNDPAAGPVYSTFTSTSLATDVQAWVDGTASNFGWVIKDSPETSSTASATIKWFESSEGTTPPTLSITFRRPLP